MPYKNKEVRREHYLKHKEEINRKRREHESNPIIKNNIRNRDRIWRKKNRIRFKDKWNLCKRNSDLKKKKLVFEYYGNKCSCCGESNLMFLSIDHIEGHGNKHRNQIKTKFYNWLVKNNFPSGFQTLCFNCNWGRHINGGVCPHKTSH